MIQLIVGKEGKGKTKQILDKVNEEIKGASGNIVYLDRSSKNMFELNNKVRLIDVSEYNFNDSSELIGFIYGIISQDHDIEQIYIDGLMKMVDLDVAKLNDLCVKLDSISNKFKFTLIASASVEESDVIADLKDKVIVSL